ncbi:MAG: membrane protein insertion efficiency factor YidD [Ruminococcaceae bacterium]|nr:membrane protein insertion efficiency factor YidD [Oscillospiraceae bacterium]
MKHLFIWLIRFYRRYLSGLKRQPCCRFTPTCSEYALLAFQKRGFFVGFLLMWMRIFRCQPFCAGGYDPVPERGLRNPRYAAFPITKYYYPEEYGLENGENTDSSQ